MNPVAVDRRLAIEKFEASYGAMLAAAEELRTALLADAGLGATHPRALRIMRVVAEDFGMPVSALASQLRIEDYVLPRHLAMALCMRLTTLGSVRIGRAFNRDHGSVLHAGKSIKARLDQDAALAARFAKLEALAKEALKAA